VPLVVRGLAEAELPLADRIFRQAFGTFIGLPDPARFAGDADYVRTRWRASPLTAFAAELDGELVGTNFVARWGSVGFFGPLTVRPDLWDRGVGRRLLEPTMACFAAWGTTLAGLFTFPHSAKHVALYGAYGFHPRFLTAVMATAVRPPDTPPPWHAYGAAPAGERDAWRARCRALTDAIHAGLDLGDEIAAVATQGLGETVLVGDASDLAAFAVCHVGAGSEAGSGCCYVKFGAAAPGPRAARDFQALLDACHAFAHARGAARLVVGINLAREHAYRLALACGFRTEIQGVALHRPNDPGYSRPDVYAIDDWR
jgi:GNAT superfamily N-acetyltransferase